MRLLDLSRYAMAGLAAVALTGTAALAQDAPQAETEYGTVSGKVEEGMNVFLGIPYGADTAGSRFMPPEEPESWDGVRDATEYFDTTPQTERTSPLFASWVPDPLPAQSENMLGLNVWTPGLDDRKRPVMVWFHGGGFITGSGSSTVYDGVRLASRGDIVLVTVNHRLNALGYLYLGGLEGGEAYADSGNIGNLDMVQSLEWVRDNIENFGGDPDRVTIFGESGGGAKVSALLAMPMADGLFHRAIVQSGSMTETRTIKSASQDTAEFLRVAGIEGDPFEALEAMSVEEMVEAVGKALAAGVGFAPVVDGRSLPRQPFSPDAPDISRDIPMLVGTNDDERSLYHIANRADVDAMAYEDIPGELASDTVSEAQAQALYEGYRDLYPDQSPKELYITILSDMSFTRGAIKQVTRKAAQGGAPVWMYLFDWDTPVMDGWLGAPHALELAFMFDNLEKSRSMVGDAAPAQPVADMMAEAWIAFARHGDPNARGLPHWPAYDAEARTAMVFDLDPEVREGYLKGEESVLAVLDE